MENKDKKRNKYADWIFLMAFCEMFCGFLMGFQNFESDFYLGLFTIIGAIFGGILTLGFAEIIQLLEDIKNKIDKE